MSAPLSSPRAAPLRIVLLGASGFVGSAVLRRMAGWRGEKEVHVLLHRAPLNAAYDFAVRHDGSITLLPSGLFPRQPHVVIHCASKQIDSDGSGFAVNGKGIEALAKAVNRYTRAVIYASSFSVYGDGPQQGVGEDAEIAPQSELARSRVESEAKLAELARSRGVPCMALRTRFVVGEGDRFFLPVLVKIACAGMQIGDESQRFSIIDVDDYASVMLNIAERLIGGKNMESPFTAFNAGYEKPISLAEIRHALQETFNLRAPLRRLDISESYLNTLEKLPVSSIHQLVQRLRLLGYDHYGQMHKLSTFIGGGVLKRDPRDSLRKAAAGMARHHDSYSTLS
jgi:nucleoside-diphosphate-sugar epimerase